MLYYVLIENISEGDHGNVHCDTDNRNVPIIRKQIFNIISSKCGSYWLEHAPNYSHK